MASRDAGEPFVFLHVGDLHVNDDPTRPPAQARRILADFDAILTDIGMISGQKAFDFVYLPGDLAENGCASEYDKILKSLSPYPSLPVRIIPGDHDRQTGVMDDFAAFYARAMTGVNAACVNSVPRPFADCPPRACHDQRRQFYFFEDIGRVRCIFLDMVSAGYGQKGVGLDFRLDPQQTAWLEGTIAEARQHWLTPVVFMHAYPADFREADDGAAVASLFWAGGVRLVEMGHTHYNELAFDGRTLYAAARSVGQNEDGPVGYAVGAIDGDVASWRFRQFQLPWPFVMITSPADRRVASAPLEPSWDGHVIVRAVAFSDQPDRLVCRCRVDGAAAIPMTRRGPRLFQASVPWPAGSRTLSVEAEDGRAVGHDYVDRDVIEPAPLAKDFIHRPLPDRLGSDDCRLGPWLAKGVRGDRLGPNRFGRKW